MWMWRLFRSFLFVCGIIGICFVLWLMGYLAAAARYGW